MKQLDLFYEEPLPFEKAIESTQRTYDNLYSFHGWQERVIKQILENQHSIMCYLRDKHELDSRNRSGP